jgi:hypothetical protein
MPPTNVISQIQHRQYSREKILEHKRQVTRSMRNHKRDNHKDGD